MKYKFIYKVKTREIGRFFMIFYGVTASLFNKMIKIFKE